MTHRVHALQAGSQWRRSPSAPVSMRPRTVLFVIAAVALGTALVLGVGVGTWWMLVTTRHPVDMTLSPSAPLQQGADSALADLAWLAGTWREERDDGRVLEERWDAPLGNSMTGTMRWLKGGEASMYEFLLLEEGEDGVRLHVRHFHPGSVAWEEKDAPLTLELAELAEREVVFTSVHDFPSRYAMRLGEDAILHVVLEGERDGQPTRLEFAYPRVGQ